MSSKNYRAPLLHYIKLSVSFQTPRWIQTEVTVWKPSIRVKICDFFVQCGLKFWWIILKSNRVPLLCCFKLHVWFHSHQWIQTKVTVPKCSIQVKISNFLSCVALKSEGWPWKNRAPLLCYFKICTSLHSHWWIQTAVAVQKSTILLAVWPWNLTDDLKEQ